MKRFLCLMLVFIFACVSVVSAEGIEFYQDGYVPGETMQFSVPGETVYASRIFLYNASNVEIKGISPLVQVIRGDSYVSMNVPDDLVNGTYTLKADGMETTFDIIDVNDALQFKPAFVVLDKNDDRFTIVIKNVLRHNTLLANSSTDSLRPYKVMKVLDAKDTLNLYVDYIYENLSEDAQLFLFMGERSYTIPVFYPGAEAADVVPEEEVVAEQPVVAQPVEEEAPALVFLVSTTQVEKTLAVDQTLEDTLSVQNQLNVPLSNLSFSLTGDIGDIVSLNETTLDSLDAGETFTVHLTVNERKDAVPGTYEGNLLFGNDAYSASLPFSLTVEEAALAEEETEVVTIEPLQKEEGEGTNTVLVVGLVIIALLAFLIVLVVLKLRQRPEKRFRQYIEETRKKK